MLNHRRSVSWFHVRLVVLHQDSVLECVHTRYLHDYLEQQLSHPSSLETLVKALLVKSQDWVVEDRTVLGLSARFDQGGLRNIAASIVEKIPVFPHEAL